jgi:hypothetical protein
MERRRFRGRLPRKAALTIRKEIEDGSGTTVNDRLSAFLTTVQSV